MEAVTSPITRQAHVDHMLSQAPAWSAELWRRTLEALRAASADLAMANDRQLLFQVAEALQRQRTLLEATFAQAVREAAGGQVAPRAPAPPVNLDELTLVDERHAERQIEIARTVNWVEVEADWEMREMQRFAAMLPGAPGPLDGRPRSAAELNPFRPAHFAAALSDSLPPLKLAEPERQLLLRLAGKCLAGLLKQVYAQECQRLREAGVIPQGLRAPHATPAAGPPGGAASPPVDMTRPGALADLAQRHPALAVPTEPPTPTAGAPLPPLSLNLDTEAMLRTLQRNVGSAAPVAGGPRTALDGQQASALLGRLWATMNQDKQLLPPVRQLIGHLKEAAVDMARRQPQMVDDPQHPLWRLVEHLTATAAGFANAEDPEFKAFLAHVTPRITKVAQQRPARPADFADTQVHSQMFLEEQARALLEAAATPVQASVQALRADDRRQAVRPLLAQQVEQQMNLQLGNLLRERVRVRSDGQEVRKRPRLPAAISQFLLGPWVDALSHAMDEDTPDADSHMQALLHTTERLLHSLQPPESVADQQALREALPPLVSAVQAAMAHAQVPEAELTAALDALMVVHTQYLRQAPRPARDDDASGPESTHEEAAWQARPTGMDTNIGMLPTVPMALLEAQEAEAARQQGLPWLNALHIGCWIKLQLDGQWLTCRVLWRSEHGNYLVVRERQHGLLHSLTRRALSKLYQGGLATSLQPATFMQRTVEAMLQGQSSAPAP